MAAFHGTDSGKLLRKNYNSVTILLCVLQKNKIEYQSIVHVKFEHDRSYFMRIIEFSQRLRPWIVCIFSQHKCECHWGVRLLKEKKSTAIASFLLSLYSWELLVHLYCLVQHFVSRSMSSNFIQSNKNLEFSVFLKLELYTMQR